MEVTARRHGRGARVDAYLSRLGLDAEPPSADALARLHRRHVERVPYETLWIQLGQLWGIDPVESFTRVATTARGGYCFHLNGAFSELLAALGYRVTRHVGGVHGDGGPDAEAMGNHLALTVHGLPTDDHESGTWYVDAGLGDALYEPLPLCAGGRLQPPLRLRLEATRAGVGDWHLVHDPSGSFCGMAWSECPASMDSFAERHEWLSTSPDSGFVRVLVVARRDATGVDVLRDLVIERLGARPGSRLIEGKGELRDALGDVFGLGPGDVGARALEALWARLVARRDASEGSGSDATSPAPGGVGVRPGRADRAGRA